MKKDYKRHYINIELRRNKSETKHAPQFIRHSITSPALTAHFINCYQNKLPFSFDVSAFLDYDDLTAVVTISVPHILNYKRDITNYFYPEERDDDES